MIGLGLALAQPALRALVLTGDGEALMGLAALPPSGSSSPANLVIVVLDNQALLARPACSRATPGPASIWWRWRRHAGSSTALHVSEIGALSRVRDLVHNGRGPILVQARISKRCGAPHTAFSRRSCDQASVHGGARQVERLKARRAEIEACLHRHYRDKPIGAKVRACAGLLLPLPACGRGSWWLRGPLHKGGLAEAKVPFHEAQTPWRGPLSRNLREERANFDLPASGER